MTFTPLPVLEQELDEIRRDCGTNGWDGYGAEPVSDESYHWGRHLISLLPATIPVPNVAAAPDGCFVFEWSTGPTAVVSVSPSAHGVIDFAALFDHEKTYGHLEFDDRFPCEIERLILRIFPLG